MSLRKIKKISKFGVLFRKKFFFNFQIDKSVNPDPNFSVCFFTLLESFDLGEEREKGEELKKFSKNFCDFSEEPLLPDGKIPGLFDIFYRLSVGSVCKV